jgi:hypothetical protein
MERVSGLRRVGVTEKTYILGRRDPTVKEGTLNIGRYLALDGSLGANVYLDALHPHVILICGKRGYGKSFTMGTIIEEIISLPDEIKGNLSALIIDTMGIFWTMVYRNTKYEDLLSKWRLTPESFEVKVFVPKGKISTYENREVIPFSIKVSELEASDWCSLLNVDGLHPLGILITRAIENLKEDSGSFSLEDVIENIRNDGEAEKEVRKGAENYLRAVNSWGIFEKEGTSIHELIKGGQTSILDVSSVKDLNVKCVILSLIGKKIYDERVIARRSYEQRAIGISTEMRGIPMVWMFIDEAHIFLPRVTRTPATDVLVNEWMKQGRQPGLSLIMATQRPAALHSEVISQSDIIICHRITAQEDIEALSAIRPTFMRESIGEAIRKMGRDKGVALIVDDTSESTHILRIRPRRSWHGGEEPSALEKFG